MAKVARTSAQEFVWVSGVVVPELEVFYNGGIYRRNYAVIPAVDHSSQSLVYLIALSETGEVIALKMLEAPPRLRVADASMPSHYFDIFMSEEATVSGDFANLIGDTLVKAQCLWNYIKQQLQINSLTDLIGFACQLDSLSNEFLQMLSVVKDVGACLSGGLPRRSCLKSPFSARQCGGRAIFLLTGATRETR